MVPFFRSETSPFPSLSSREAYSTTTDHYTYDAIDQVTNVSYAAGRTVGYNYDGVGNRTSVTDAGTSTTYATKSLNQYQTVGGSTQKDLRQVYPDLSVVTLAAAKFIKSNAGVFLHLEHELKEVLIAKRKGKKE